MGFLNPNQQRAKGSLEYTGDANQSLDQVYQRTRKDYDDIYRPINRKHIQSTESNDLVNAALKTNEGAIERSAQRQDRVAGRYGLEFSNFERAEAGRRGASNRALNYEQLVGSTRLEQDERNNRVRNGLVAVGRGIDASAFTQLNNASQLQTQRELANTNLEAQSDAQGKQLRAGLGSAGIVGAALLGGWPGIALGIGSAIFGLL